MTQVIDTPATLFAHCERIRRQGGQIGFVPTMGALHAGHLSLVERGRAEGADHVVVSIFVNPLQFGPDEDFGRYPRTFDADLALCQAHRVDVVYAPTGERMYPPGFQTFAEVRQLTQPFEGSFRPDHFRGVTTVVLKLLTAVGACRALFGRKDYQQWRVITQLARDLNLPAEIIGAPIVREPDGLAMSSRNRYLSPDERTRALAIVEGLRSAHRAYTAGERDVARLVSLVREPVTQRFDSIDYIAAADPHTLTPCPDRADAIVLLVAAHVGSTRLIDNLELAHDPYP